MDALMVYDAFQTFGKSNVDLRSSTCYRSGDRIKEGGGALRFPCDGVPLTAEQLPYYRTMRTSLLIFVLAAFVPFFVDTSGPLKSEIIIKLINTKSTGANMNRKTTYYAELKLAVPIASLQTHFANVMIPSARKRYPEGTLFFQQDNHPIHTANRIQRWFTRRRDVDPVDWPPNSPDMNPIQNLWAAVKRIVRSNWAEQPPVRTPEEL
ncbi:hypothetical protein ANN_07306 [Periplaneta americana]|uniref:Tc1-like transposase DDE domain-containing protein n=1 Tax=Periplaneta americana TaxID=6978 RepID=A0ABQ8TFV0_PERAM|nr:hypothetical protein ANN_07306 [Periplaneta americana]